MSQEQNPQSPLKAWKDRAMDTKGIDCNHDCRVTCKMLTEAIHRESEIIQFYEQLLGECDYPDVNAFVRELLEEKSRIVLRINQKLNEIRVRGQISSGIISSFDPDSL